MLILDPSADDVHNENITYSLTRGLFYALHPQRNGLLANIRNEDATQSIQHIWSTRPFTTYSDYLVPANTVNPAKMCFFTV